MYCNAFKCCRSLNRGTEFIFAILTQNEKTNENVRLRGQLLNIHSDLFFCFTKTFNTYECLFQNGSNKIFVSHYFVKTNFNKDIVVYFNVFHLRVWIQYRS